MWSVPTAQFTLHMRYNMTTCCYSHHPQQAVTYSMHKIDPKHYIMRCKNKTEAVERKHSHNSRNQKNKCHAEQHFHFCLSHKNSMRCQEVIWTKFSLLWYRFWMTSLHRTDMQKSSTFTGAEGDHGSCTLNSYNGIQFPGLYKNHIYRSLMDLCFSIHKA